MGVIVVGSLASGNHFEKHSLCSLIYVKPLFCATELALSVKISFSWHWHPKVPGVVGRPGMPLSAVGRYRSVYGSQIDLLQNGIYCYQDNFEYLSGIWRGEVDSRRHRDFHASTEVRLIYLYLKGTGTLD